MNYRTTVPRIRWGTNFVNALDLAYPLDNVKAGDTPRDGSTAVQGPSGVEDAWMIGTDYVLEGDVRWIPQADVLTPRATGWDGAAGVRAFLAWARDKNVLKFHPDGRNLLLSPLLNKDTSGDGKADDWDGAITAGGVTFTPVMDATEGDQQLNVTASTQAGTIGLFQDVTGILPGESLVLSVDSRIDAAATVAARIIMQALDANNAVLTSSSGPSTSSTAYVRLSTNAFAVPVNTAKIRCYIEASIGAAGQTGKVWHKNAMLRRAGVTDTTFIDNPQITSYLVAPMKDPAPSESDGTRKLTLRLRNGSVAYDGY